MITTRKRHLLAATLGGLLAFASFGMAQAADVTISHAKGEITLSTVPKKVLTFDLAALDTLNALGIEVAGVPSGPKPDYLAAYKNDKYLTIGTLFEPDYEAVNAAAPDLIIVAGRSAAKYPELSKIAPTIDLTVHPQNYMKSAQTNIETLATIFDKKAEATVLLEKLASTTAALKEKSAAAGKGLLILTTGGKMSAYGPGSRFGVLHSDYGVAPAADDLKTGTHGQAISFEFILETNPEWLYVIDRDSAIGREGTAAKQYLDNEIVRQTNAWKNGRVVYLDGVSWYLVGGGITAMQTTVDQLTAALSQG